MSDDKLYRIEAKIDKVSDRISSIDSTLAAQHESLKDHIRRTELLENAIEPIKKHVTMVEGVIKSLLLGAAIAGGIEGLVVLLEYLRK